jgi:hypothetical protein
MDEMIAFCGLTCTQCPGYLATQNDDDDARRKVAEEWSKEFKAEIKPEDINCDGCIVTDGRHIGYCSMCEIRKCGLGRAVENCAHCADYACDKLEKFLSQVPDARKTLEGIRGGLE